MRGEVQVIHSYNIDKAKWDRCVTGSANALIYANSTWLDHLADNWAGIVLNDYQAVMPVAWRKKWGIRYSYHVPFIQQLGIFSLAGNEDMKQFSDVLTSFCRYGVYPFNYANKVDAATAHTNFVLTLDRKNDELISGFSADVVQNIRKAERGELQYKPVKFDDAITIFREMIGLKTGVADEDFRRVWKLCGYLEKRGNLIVRAAIGRAGETLAVALLPNDGRRLYNIMNTALPEGRKAEANYFLLWEIWKEFESSGLVFDFEGSDIPGVREFYRKFGASNQPYFRLGFNRLPWPLKILRK